MTLPQSSSWNKFNVSSSSLSLTLLICKSKELGLKIWAQNTKFQNLETDLSMLRAQLHYWLAVWTWACRLLLWNSSFLICKMKKSLISTFQGFRRIQLYTPKKVPKHEFHERKSDSFCCLFVFFSHQKRSIQMEMQFWFIFTLMTQSTRKDFI